MSEELLDAIEDLEDRVSSLELTVDNFEGLEIEHEKLVDRVKNIEWEIQ